MVFIAGAAIAGAAIAGAAIVDAAIAKCWHQLLKVSVKWVHMRKNKSINKYDKLALIY